MHILIFITFVIMLGFLWYCINFPKAQIFGKVIVSGPKSPKSIALTFDDGPNPKATEKILAILRAYQVHATFFIIGQNALHYPKLVKQITADGHEIGMHTMSHSPFFILQSPKKQYHELQRCQTIILDITGKRATLFRPPWGNKTPLLFKQAKKLRLQIVNWSVDSDEVYRGPIRLSSTEMSIAKRVITRVKAGDIVLMHDGHGTKADERNATIAAVPHVLDNLIKQGYTVTTVSDLLKH